MDAPPSMQQLAARRHSREHSTAQKNDAAPPEVGASPRPCSAGGRESGASGGAPSGGPLLVASLEHPAEPSKPTAAATAASPVALSKAER